MYQNHTVSPEILVWKMTHLSSIQDTTCMKMIAIVSRSESKTEIQNFPRGGFVIDKLFYKIVSTSKKLITF